MKTPGLSLVFHAAWWKAASSPALRLVVEQLKPIGLPARKATSWSDRRYAAAPGPGPGKNWHAIAN